MAQLTSTHQPSGEIVASGVAEADYMEHYAAQHHEWVRGYVIKMAPISLKHDQITAYLRGLFQLYFSLSDQNRKVVGNSFVMRLAAVNSRREPDLQVILWATTSRICRIPIWMARWTSASRSFRPVTPPSIMAISWKNTSRVASVNTGCSIRRAARPISIASRQRAANLSITADADGSYRTPLLPRFALTVAMLWQDDLPGIVQSMAAVQAALKL